MMRTLKQTDIGRLIRLQDTVLSSMEDPSLLRKNTYETFLFCFERPRYAVGIFDGENLVSACIFVDAYGTEEDLSRSLKNTVCTKPINYKLVLVHPDYRGHGWQRFLFMICAKLAWKDGYEQIIATAAPANTYSCQNMLRMGMKEDHRELKYGGLLRCVMVLDQKVRRNHEPMHYEEECGSADRSLCFDGVKVCYEAGEGIVHGSDVIGAETRIPLNKLSEGNYLLLFPKAD